MRRRAVTSSAIASVGYEESTAELEIEFVSGEVYRYFAVPRSVHTDLLSAPSIGRYFQRHIRDRYPTRQQ
ncbi:KTSC domain-containing protein [Microbacterium esteraromaticum]|uniref:KTSC domain-containing protein n=1 Tax=Microbacterium esteraromaticum TaxID=57043 RepID=A0A7D8AIG7_9MICO|nr:KTSC domain-containing protein [Microbacterium esteraromaticum]QMU98282.1 KTSC domain-containing protein [Microbacterium esteraromaticum]